jgi:hypothetical protein
MQAIVRLTILTLAAAALSGCVAVDVASTAVDAAATVAGTAVDVGATVVKTTAHTVAGSDDEDKKDDRKSD